MKLHRKYKLATLGVAIFCTAVSASALTLGRANGAVHLGQSLKLAVPIQMEAGEGASALCFEADVFYGDSKQDAGRVSVGSEYFPQSQSAQVKITALTEVDEPVVTVYLRAGCANKTTRRFVLLAEMATDTPPQATRSNVQPLQSVSRPASVARAAPVAASGEPMPQARKQVPMASAVAQPARTPGATPHRRGKASVVRRPHLKLAPLDLGEERDLVLKLSNELVLGEGEDLQGRALAAARWRALNARPEDVVQADNRSKALESDLKGLRDVTAKNRLILDELSRRLDRAETARYANPLVYGLLALLFICALGGAYALRRLQRGRLTTTPWWRDDGVPGKTRAVDFDDDAAHGFATRTPALPSRPMSASPVPSDAVAEAPRAMLTEVDVDLHLDAPASLAEERPSTTTEPVHARAVPDQVASKSAGHADFANSMTTTTLRAVNTQEMLDVRQQAEFFMTLGQHEEAITMLRESIDASFDANPLVYLDLLKILHTLGRKAEYDHYRTGFNAIFSGHVPVYGDFHRTGSGLEAYPDVCGCIVDRWPSEEAVSYIESCLVSPHGESFVQEFDLEAFRDLLMLHAVARRIASSFDSGFLPFSAARAAVESRVEQAQPMGATVDFDLSEPPGNLIDFETGEMLPLPASKRHKPR